MIQKAVDLYTVPGKFTPLYSYERSLPYPNGHRNVLFATRGKPILEIAAAEERGEEGAAKLYAYLHKLGGLTAAHTSATGAGTDFRDSDAEVEPIVEIYQGYRPATKGRGRRGRVTTRAAVTKRVMCRTPGPRASSWACSPARTTCRRTFLMPPSTWTSWTGKRCCGHEGAPDLCGDG